MKDIMSKRVVEKKQNVNMDHSFRLKKIFFDENAKAINFKRLKKNERFDTIKKDRFNINFFRG